MVKKQRLNILLGFIILASTLMISVVSADTPSMLYGKSVVADNHYQQNGNYDIHYNGYNCFRWISATLPVTVINPDTITYTDYYDDEDITQIISCEVRKKDKQTWDIIPITST